MIAYLLGGACLVLLIVGGITGRVRITNCCSIADPTRDARMRNLDEQDLGQEGR